MTSMQHGNIARAVNVSVHADAFAHVPEEFLIARAGREPAAFAALYRLHYKSIAGYIYRRTGDVGLTEDLTSETFLSALRAIGNYQVTGTPIRIWFLRIATNAVNAHLRSERSRKKREESAGQVRWLQLAAGAESEPGGSATPLVTDSKGDSMVRRSLQALMRLPSDQQTALCLHHVEGLSLEEIALIMDCRVGTIKSRLHRGREALRQELWNSEHAGEHP